MFRWTGPLESFSGDEERQVFDDTRPDDGFGQIDLLISTARRRALSRASPTVYGDS